MKVRKYLIASVVGLVITMTSYSNPLFAQGIPVIDATSIYNLGLQLTKLQDQFDNMQANTRTPEHYMWANVQKSMNELVQLSNAINAIKIGCCRTSF